MTGNKSHQGDSKEQNTRGKSKANNEKMRQKRVQGDRQTTTKADTEQ